jgi:hypothetical protein
MNLTGTDIVKILRNNDRAVARALVVLKNRQLESEQRLLDSVVKNNRGFRPCHAKKGTEMANFYEKNGYLTYEQIAYWRKIGKQGMRISIYWKQLLHEAHLKVNAVVDI